MIKTPQPHFTIDYYRGLLGYLMNTALGRKNHRQRKPGPQSFLAYGPVVMRAIDLFVSLQPHEFCVTKDLEYVKSVWF